MTGPPSPTSKTKPSPASIPSRRASRYAEWLSTKINFIDTPGIGSFLAEARSAMRVVEAALVVADAVHGAEVQTESTWAGRQRAVFHAWSR